MIAALATLAVGLGLGVIAECRGDDEPVATATATAIAPTEEDGAQRGAATEAQPLQIGLPAIEPDPALMEEAVVTGIVDGDTIDVSIDGREERVRYYGVDTPERGDRCFDAATARTEALAGDRVLLLPDARERDRYDRLLRYIFTESGESIDALLIAEGLGEAWREDGAYRDELVVLEGEARSADVGCLWE